MEWMLLPRSPDCLVCGRDNARGLRLRLSVSPSDGQVRCGFTPDTDRSGFPGLAHGGAASAVLDEAMVWAAAWRIRRFCLCAEMTLRFRQPAVVGRVAIATARVVEVRSRLILTESTIADEDGKPLITATGKYMPMAEADHHAFARTLIDEPDCCWTLERLLQGDAAAGTSDA